MSKGNREAIHRREVPQLMKTLEHYFGEFAIVLKGSLLFLIGPINAQLGYVAVAVLIDLMFGIRVAVKTKSFSWNIFVKKVSNKILIYAAWIALFNALDMVVGLPSTARTSVIVLLISMEILSASKNTAKLGYGKLAGLLENIYYLVSKDVPAAPKEDDKEGGEQK